MQDLWEMQSESLNKNKRKEGKKKKNGKNSDLKYQFKGQCNYCDIYRHKEMDWQKKQATENQNDTQRQYGNPSSYILPSNPFKISLPEPLHGYSFPCKS